ncbi:MAG: cysteine methyltransferase, partial [Deltaproteobacteria bacterium]
MLYDFFDTGLVGTLSLVADEKGLRQIIFPNRYHRENISADWQRQPVFFKEIKRQLRAYFAGELTNFDLTIAPRGTDFQQTVWRALQKIPYGEVVVYKKIAEAIGNPKAVRAVGSANGKNPIPIIIPC